MSKSPIHWSVPIRLDEVPETGRHVELVADEATRASLAQAAGLAGLSRLAASFDLARQGSTGLRVSGNVSASVRQTCVVTLEPVDNEVEEAVDLVFASASAGGSASPTSASNATLDSPEPPEAMSDGTVDLGVVATEFLLLGIDPYPRKPGAVFEPPPGSDTRESPFAALAGLRTGPGKRGN